jgi:hypothetical protein
MLAAGGYPTGQAKCKKPPKKFKKYLTDGSGGGSRGAKKGDGITGTGGKERCMGMRRLDCRGSGREAKGEPGQGCCFMEEGIDLWMSKLTVLPIL